MATQDAQVQNEMIELGVHQLVVRGHGQDLLMGKNVKHYLAVPGLENLLHRFILDLDAAFTFIYKHDVAQFLDTLQSQFKLDLMSLRENLLANIANMIDMESDDVMIYNLVITKTLEAIRQQVFETQFWALIEKTINKKTPKMDLSQIHARIEALDDAGNEVLSLMYNLMFIQFLAKFYQENKLLTKITSVISEKMEALFKNIS